MKKVLSLSCLPLLISLSSLVQADTGSSWPSNLTFSGTVEVEAFISDDYDGSSYGNDASDIILATVELAFDARINDKVSARLSALYEEDDTPFDIDEGIISLDFDNSTSLSVGQMYVPFGNFETHMISDSLPLELGEIRETALLLDLSSDKLYVSIYAFNGDVQETGEDDEIASLGFNLMYVSETMTAGFSYLSNMTDTDSISGIVGGTVASFEPGMSLYANISADNIAIFLEYLTSLDEFSAGSGALTGAQPSASNIEVGIPLNDGTMAFAIQTSDEAVALGLPETRLMASYSKEVMKDTSLAFEVAFDQDYDTAEGGTDESALILTGQLAVSF